MKSFGSVVYSESNCVSAVKRINAFSSYVFSILFIITQENQINSISRIEQQPLFPHSISANKLIRKSAFSVKTTIYFENSRLFQFLRSRYKVVVASENP